MKMKELRGMERLARERVNYGGVLLTRHEVYTAMLEGGHDHKAADAFAFGYSKKVSDGDAGQWWPDMVGIENLHRLLAEEIPF